MKKYVLSFKSFHFVIYLAIYLINIFKSIFRYWPKLDTECALWSKVRFWGKSHFFKKKSRIPKNMQSYEISFWEVKTDTLGHLLRQHYFWKNWNMKIIFQKSGFLRKKQCFSVCKMTLKAYSYFICRNILILLRMVLN